MSILEDVHSDKARVTVTGIDISHICLNTAKRAIYKREMFRQVDQKFIDLYFEDDRGDLRVKDEVKNLVEFKFTNCVNSEAMDQLGQFDVVICRNIFTDFSQKGRERMAENIYNILVPGGVLLIGGKESLYNVTKAFRLQTFDNVVAYRKL
jgi:chemotaxis protein methyltransferase CheR